MLRRSLLIFWLLAATATGQVKVKSESLAVHEDRDNASAVVKTLERGDEVVIDMSITGPDNARWCTIRENGKKERLGYVHCDSLERPALRVRTPSEADPARPPAPHSWDLANLRTLGETKWLGYAGLVATTFQFSEPQKQQVAQLANHNGMPACIQATDSYTGPGMPPELLSGSPITPCHWYAQSFYEQVFALITPEQKAAREASYQSFSREVTGNRHVLEQRAKGQ